MGRVSGGKSRKKAKQREKAAVGAVFILTFAVAAAGLIWFMKSSGKPSTEHMEAAAYFGEPSPDEVTVVTSDAVLPRKALRGTETAYIAYEDALEYLNGRMYFDEKAELLTIALPDRILNLQAERSERPDTQEAVITPDGLYLSVSFLETCSDFEAGTLADTPQFVIRTDFTLPQASVREDCAVRMNPDIKSVIIRDLAAGETVTVLEAGDSFTRISTADGFIGYTDSTLLGTAVSPGEHTSAVGAYTHLQYDFPICLVFHQTDSQAANNALSKSLEGTHGINVIAPTWYFLEGQDGSFRDLSSRDYVEYAHSRGMKVWAVANDFDGALHSPADTLAVLSDTETRQDLADKIAFSAKECGADGINLDYENVREDSAGAYLMFIRELSVLCREYGLILSVDSYVPQNYNLYLDRAAQAEAADYIVTMAYDEHYAGSQEAGSVSSISWVRQAAEGTAEEVPVSRIIIALPFYTRIWESSSGSTPTSRAMGMREAENYVKSLGITPSWDETTMQDYAETIGGNKQQVWLENAKSLRAKLDLLKAYEIAGIAAWKLGLETPDIWDLIEEYNG